MRNWGDSSRRVLSSCRRSLSWTRYSPQQSWSIPRWTTTGLWSRGQRIQVISPVWICLLCRRNSSLSSVNLWINSERKLHWDGSFRPLQGLLTVVNLHRRKSNRLPKGTSSRPLWSSCNSTRMCRRRMHRNYRSKLCILYPHWLAQYHSTFYKTWADQKDER